MLYIASLLWKTSTKKQCFAKGIQQNSKCSVLHTHTPYLRGCLAACRWESTGPRPHPSWCLHGWSLFPPAVAKASPAAAPRPPRIGGLWDVWHLLSWPTPGSEDRRVHVSGIILWNTVLLAELCPQRMLGMNLADEKKQVCMASEVHGEEEEGEFLDHADAALVSQRERKQLNLGRLFRYRCLGVQGRARPLGCPPQPDQIFKVLQGEKYNQRGSAQAFFSQK